MLAHGLVVQMSEEILHMLSSLIQIAFDLLVLSLLQLVTEPRPMDREVRRTR